MTPRERKLLIVLASIFGGLFLLSRIVMESTPKPSDRELFLSFYRDVLQKSAAIDETYRPFGEAMEKKDMFEATVAGKRIKTQLDTHWYEFAKLTVPTLNNEKAKKALKDGKELLDAGYYNKIGVVASYLEFTKEPSSLLLKAAEMKDNAEKYQARLIMGLASIMGAGSELGIKPEELPQ
ncbi:MAG: hypothetical protein Q8J64_06390 [Thermodesulfovibrionales bacterium]|nr:hypothetical protein [Thermodesulfovibrionales bacterium]